MKPFSGSVGKPETKETTRTSTSRGNPRIDISERSSRHTTPNKEFKIVFFETPEMKKVKRYTSTDTAESSRDQSPNNGTNSSVTSDATNSVIGINNYASNNSSTSINLETDNSILENMRPEKSSATGIDSLLNPTNYNVNTATAPQHLFSPIPNFNTNTFSFSSNFNGTNQLFNTNNISTSESIYEPYTDWNNEEIVPLVHDIAHNLNDILSMNLDAAFNDSLKEIINFDDFLLNKGPQAVVVPLSNVSFDLRQEDDAPLSFASFLKLKSFKELPLELYNIPQNHYIYLEIFYDVFSGFLSPLSPDLMVDPMRNIILYYCLHSPYLLCSVLSCSARYLFLKSGNTNQTHEVTYCGYLSQCLKKLDKVYSDEAKTQSQIEPLLLTTLLLTVDRARSKGKTWRTHLRGTKELLTRFTIASNNTPYKCTITLALCKNMFNVCEILAGLSTRNGGSANNNYELDMLIRDDDLEIDQRILVDIGIVRRDGFYLHGGFSMPSMKILRDVVKLIRKAQISKQDIRFLPTPLEILSVLGRIEHELKFEVIHGTQDCVIPTSSVYHLSNYNYDYKQKHQMDMNPDDIGTAVINNNQICFSWYDVSHRTHLWACYLIILTTKGLLGLPKTYHLVQQIVKTILGLMYYLRDDAYLTSGVPPDKFPRQTMMVQWIMIVTGINCIDENDKILVKRFFNGLLAYGVYNAEFSYKKVKKAWAKNSTIDDVNDYDCDDDIDDTVPY